MIISIFYFILLIDCGILLNGFVVIEMLAKLGARGHGRNWLRARLFLRFKSVFFLIIFFFKLFFSNHFDMLMSKIIFKK
jgi:hypothetical protein